MTTRIFTGQAQLRTIRQFDNLTVIEQNRNFGEFVVQGVSVDIPKPALLDACRFELPAVDELTRQAQELKMGYES